MIFVWNPPAKIDCMQLHQIDNPTTRDVAAAPQTPQLGGPRPTVGAQVSLKLLFGYVTIFSSADLFTTDLNCGKKLACDIINATPFYLAES